MNAAWSTQCSPSEKLVLLALADWANDDGVCWPSIKKLSEKSSAGERSVQRAIKSLIAAGHLSREDRPGKGVLFTVHPRQYDTPVNLAPVTPVSRRGVNLAPNTSRHTTNSEANASSLVRAKPSKRCPDSWVPDGGVFEVGRKSGLSPGEIDGELEKLRDYEFRSSKTDWNATARNWLRTAGTRNAKSPGHERITSIAGLNERDRNARDQCGLLD